MSTTTTATVTWEEFNNGEPLVYQGYNRRTYTARKVTTGKEGRVKDRHLVITDDTGKEVDRRYWGTGREWYDQITRLDQ